MSREVVHGGELFDLLVRAGFLRPELITREREELQALMVKLGVKVQQPLVVAGGVASFARHVDDQRDLALEEAERGVDAVHVHGTEGVETLGGSD